MKLSADSFEGDKNINYINKIHLKFQFQKASTILQSHKLQSLKQISIEVNMGPEYTNFDNLIF